MKNIACILFIVACMAGASNQLIDITKLVCPAQILNLLNLDSLSAVEKAVLSSAVCPAILNGGNVCTTQIVAALRIAFKCTATSTQGVCEQINSTVPSVQKQLIAELTAFCNTATGTCATIL